LKASATLADKGYLLTKTTTAARTAATDDYGVAEDANRSPRERDAWKPEPDRFTRREMQALVAEQLG
jgi:hypothetical protein